MTWIPCEEDLPEDGQEVLIYSSYWNKIFMAKFERGKVPKQGEVICQEDQDGNNKVPWKWFGYVNHYGQTVSHWMPLPEEPSTMRIK